jgi:outer membrane protein OmpA-like peptidoglycan-associated protein
MKILSREWMWTVSGLSLLLLIGCETQDNKPNVKLDPPKVSGMPSVEKVAYAPEATLKKKTKTETKELKPTLEGTKKVEMPSTKPIVTASGAFVASQNLKPVYFEFNKSKLSDDVLATVKDNADWIKSQPPFLVKVIGISDPRGSTMRNKTLAERRALKLKEAYVAQGIPAERIQLAAIAEDGETCLPMTEECLKLSRRAETQIESKALFAQK